MTLRNYLRVLRERWIIVLVLNLVAVSAACAFWALRPAEYTANLRLYVSAQSVDTTQSAFQGAQLSQERVTSYVELVSSTRVSEEVARRLRRPETPADLAKQITASSKLDSVIIDVFVTGTSPQDTAAIANTIGEVFPQLVEELERPSSPTGVSPVIVRVVQPAVAPVEPSSPGLPVIVGMAICVGFALGVGLAFARNALDTSIKDIDQLGTVANSPNLGIVVFNSTVPKKPLTLQEEPQSPRAEAFRQLRTNLQFLDVDTPHKVVAISSSMPSEGKTTTLANLAISLASAGQRVVAIEADLRRPTLANVLGVERSVGLTSVLAGRVRLEHAIQHWSGGMFDVLASGPLPPNPSELLGSRHMAALLSELRSTYDVVLIDTPPLLPVTDAAAIAPATDGAIMVCRFKRTTREQVASAVQALKAVSTPVLGTVLTMVPTSGPRAYARYNTYYQTTGADAPESPATGMSVRPQSRVTDARTSTTGYRGVEQPLRPAPHRRA